MKVIAINSTYRPKGSTTMLTRKALEGVASTGVEAEMIMLRDHDIRYCQNCLKCYRDVESELAPCTIDDDVTGILRKMLDADGLIFASPVHNGFLTGLMTAFYERAVWRVCKPTGELAGLKGVPAPRSTKVRAIATIASAGGMPEKLAKLCNDGTKFIRENMPMSFNGHYVGEIYAGADLVRMPASDQDWQRLYFLRRVSDRQLRMAYDLGVKMGQTLNRGRLKPDRVLGGFTAAMAKLYMKTVRLYNVVGEKEGGDEARASVSPPEPTRPRASTTPRRSRTP
ncbi:MAG: flavodoxin family protein [Deltaproteobacteria bacterium]|nr:flavodoxin family protein [Deltaproteobacteria bacterium]